MPSNDPKVLADDVRAEAHRLGFDLVGITAPDPPPHVEVYRSWLEQGMHGEMDYLASAPARDRRADPRRILPECESILVVGTGYLPQSGAVSAEGPVSAYALGQDYHQVLVRRLKRLVSALEVKWGAAVPHRIYTDTGPLLERELAQRAGLGWIGKNTCLIHPRRGSYFFLAEVLLGVTLAPDPPFTADHCGSCTRCIQACPTQCILPDRTLDARRCISYLTIEHKGSIPGELRALVGGWIFGCDKCQQVCPWNLRFARPTQDPAFQPRPFLEHPSMDRFLALDEQGFQRELKDSPLKRPKRRGLLRNAAIGAGNRGDPSSIPPLAALLEDRQPLVRGHAAWALGQIGGRQAIRALRRAQQDEADESVLEEIKTALRAAG